MYKNVQGPASTSGALVGLVCFYDSRPYDELFHQNNGPFDLGPICFSAHAAVALASPIVVKGNQSAFHLTPEIERQVANLPEVQKWSHWPGLSKCWSDGRLLAISVQQPYAGALVLSIKLVENRGNYHFVCPRPVESQHPSSKRQRTPQAPTIAAGALQSKLPPLNPLPPLPTAKPSRFESVLEPQCAAELVQEQNDKDDQVFLHTPIMEALLLNASAPMPASSSPSPAP